MAELSDAHVRLVPLRDAPPEAIWAAAQSIAEWTLSLAPFGHARERISDYIAKVSAQEDLGRALPFAVFDRRTERFVGSTRLTELDREHRRAELGYTWYDPAVWGTMVNPACKRLLLRHAFETLELERVVFYVNLRSERSWRAVERLGAVREGVLRHDRLMPNGVWRDTVVLSILRDEWPSVRAGLDARLDVPT